MNLQQIKYSIIDEVTPGTSPALPGSGGWTADAVVIPIKGLGTLDKAVERKADELILGNSMEGGMYDVASNVNGNLALSPRACAGFGRLVKGALGLEALSGGNPYQIGGVIVLRYTGASASCKIVASATEITSAIGALGAEVADAAFGTGGTLTLAGFATLGALVTELNAGNYVCTKLMGADALSTTAPGPVAITAVQAAGKNVYIFFKSTTTGVYLHQLTPDLTQAERASFSILKEGVGDNLLYSGAYVNELSLAGTLKAQLTGEAILLGFTEMTGQVVSGLPQPAAKALVFQSGTIFMDGKAFTYVRNFSWKATNNMFADGYGMGSLDRQYVLKSKFAVTGDMQLRLDVDSYAERANVFANGKNMPTAMVFTGGDIGGAADGLKEGMIIEMPYLQLQKYEFAENSGILDAKLTWQLFNPGVDYDGPLTVSLITTDAGAY